MKKLETQKIKVDSLIRTHQLLANHSALLTKGQLGGGGGEFGQTGNGQVLVVEVHFADLLLRLDHTGQHVRLALVIAVGAYAEVDLLRVGVRLVRLGDAENGVRWAHLHVAEP